MAGEYSAVETTDVADPNTSSSSSQDQQPTPPTVPPRRLKRSSSTVSQPSYVAAEEDEDVDELSTGRFPWSSVGGFWSYISFGWMGPMLKAGAAATLQVSDVPELPRQHSAGKWAVRFSREWVDECMSRRPPSLWHVLWKLFWFRLAYTVVLSLAKNTLQLFSARLLQLLILSLTDATASLGVSFGYALALFVCSWLAAVFKILGYQVGSEVGMNARTVLVSSIYSKVLRLDVNVSKGTIVTMFSTDANRINRLAETLETAVTCPLVIGVSLVMLYNVLGYAIIATIIAGLLLVPFNWALSHRLQSANEAITVHQQDRMKLISEAMQGILAIKLLGWEHVAADRIGISRRHELNGVKNLSYSIATYMTLIWSAGIAMAVASLALYAVIGGELSAAVVFPSLYLFDNLLWPLLHLPRISAVISASNMSIRRIQEFLLRPEVHAVPAVYNSDAAIVLEDVSFTWPDNEVQQPAAETKSRSSLPAAGAGYEMVSLTDHSPSMYGIGLPILQSVRLVIKPGELVAVVGKVGAGKSSLLMGILGELSRDNHTIGVRGPVAFVPQQAWVRSMTVRRNILCGQQFDSQRYRQTIVACALGPDLKSLKAGDMTEVGERGVTLSGGQKQRLSMARAVYSNANVYLLDDPLSAVDARVGNWLFDQCICGVLRRKTRVLVTHQLQFLPRVDRVIIMDDGRITHMGTYQELVAQGINFTSLSEHESPSDEDDVKAGEDQVDDLSGIAADDATEVGRLVEDEERFEGKVSAAVYRAYFSSLGPAWFLLLFCVLSLSVEGSRAALQAWIASWSSHAGSDDTATFAFYLFGYVVIGVIFTVLSGTRNFSWFHATLVASRKLHERMLMAVLRAPMSFFHSTPHGRILNRFSRDQSVIDCELPDEVSDTMLTALEIIGKLVLIAFVSPLFLGVFVPIAWLYNSWASMFRKSCRELKRLEAISFSPIQNRFAETVDGLSSIRTYKQQSTEFHQMMLSQDANNQLYLALRTSSRWMSIRGQWSGAFIVLATSVLACIATKWLGGSPTMLALSVSLSMGMSTALDWFVTVGAQMEAEMARVERLLQFSSVPPEASLDQGFDPANSVPVPPGWPGHGRVQFQNVALQYRPDLPPALNGVSFIAQPGEKVGIVGRTGAGKSSLLMALFRVVELAGGSVIIDGVDVSRIGLRQLRQGVCIIPQDPVLFAGTIRWNLDPLAGLDGRPTYQDSTLWNALEKVGMKAYVAGLLGGLDHNLAEGASNLSVGQRQLLCLARALLRQAHVLVMDEATASIDPDSDALIQTTIRSEFQGRTVITIAHRLPTIIDYDRILVMDKGHVAEYDSAAALLANPQSLFFDMVAQTGPIASAFLHQAAQTRGAIGLPPPAVRLRSIDPETADVQVQS